jgi:hypothetical protein
MSDAIPPNVLAAGDPDGAIDALLEYQDALEAGHELEHEAVAPRVMWTPDDAAAAEWAMSHLAALDKEQREISDQAALWRSQIDAWEQQASRRPAARAGFYEGALIRYADVWRAADPKRRTLYLPSGDVACTVPVKPRVVVEDDAACVAWIDEHSDEIDGEAAELVDAVKRPAPSILTSELRKHVSTVRHDDGSYSVVTPDGVPIPGVVALPPGDPTYRVKPS